MYDAVLILHSYLRWLVLGLLVAVPLRSYLAVKRGRGWLETDERLHSALIQAFDIQTLLGLLLYFILSPWSRAFLSNVGMAIKDSNLRFYGLEHITLMLLSLVAVHVARVRSKKAATPILRHKRVFRGTLFGLVLVLAAIPWPGLPHGRPLLRGDSEPAPASALVPDAPNRLLFSSMSSSLRP